MTQRWKPTPEEFKRITEEHKKSMVAGENGQRADLRGADLKDADFHRVQLGLADLRGADLRGADLSSLVAHAVKLNDADLRGANIAGADLASADMSGALLQSARMAGADLFRVNMTGADLQDADLSSVFMWEARLSGARMIHTNLRRAELCDAEFEGAVLGGTLFAETRLERAKGLGEVKLLHNCHVDLATVERSWPLPESFLKGCGLPDDYIQFIHQHMFTPIQLYSCFISYSSDDEEFATRLHNDLQAKGVRCWKWDHDAKTGRSLWGEITGAIRLYEKVILIASESSLKSPEVNDEIENAILKENELFKEKSEGDDSVDTDVLFPIRLDDYVFNGWEHERKPRVLKRMIADATEWKDPEKYAELRDRLIRDLKKARRTVAK